MKQEIMGIKQQGCGVPFASTPGGACIVDILDEGQYSDINLNLKNFLMEFIDSDNDIGKLANITLLFNQ